MKTRLLPLFSLALVSLALGQTAFAQQQQNPSGGTFIPPKLTLPLLPVLPPARPLQRLESPAAIATPKNCSVPLLEMRPPSSNDAISTKPRPTQDPIEIKPPAPACPAAP